MPNERSSYGELIAHAEASRAESKKRKETTQKNKHKKAVTAVAAGLAVAGAAMALPGQAEKAMDVQANFYKPPKKVAPAAPGESSQQRAERAIKEAQEIAKLRNQLTPENETPPKPDSTGEQTKGFK